jgi:hypothetical protein
MRAGWGEFDIFEVLSREHLRMPRDNFFVQKIKIAEKSKLDDVFAKLQ